MNGRSSYFMIFLFVYATIAVKAAMCQKNDPRPSIRSKRDGTVRNKQHHKRRCRNAKRTKQKARRRENNTEQNCVFLARFTFPNH